jgi:hypothetical protein
MLRHVSSRLARPCLRGLARAGSGATLGVSHQGALRAGAGERRSRSVPLTKHREAFRLI